VRITDLIFFMASIRYNNQVPLGRMITREDEDEEDEDEEDEDEKDEDDNEGG